MPTYNPPTLTGYNQNPPSDDGTESTANRIDYDTIKSKLPDPLKNFSEAINTEVGNGFDAVDAQVTALQNGQGVFLTNPNGNPNISDTSVDIIAVSVINTFETYGPTGSGADNIWTALDSIPTTAKWVEVRCQLFNGTGGADQAFALNARAGTEVASVANEVYHYRNDPVPSNAAFFNAKLPLASGVILDLRWSAPTGAQSSQANTYLVGYGG